MKNDAKDEAKKKAKAATNVLLTLPLELNEKLKREADAQNRKRHAQIIFILERFFAAARRAKGGNK